MTESNGFVPIAEVSRRLKLELVRGWKEGMDEQDIDLITMAFAVRDGKVVAQVVAPSGPLGPRHAVKAAALFFRAEEVWAVADTVMASGVSREDAENVKPGQMTQAWARGEREGLSEGLMACRLTPEGAAEMHSWPYVRDGTKLEWGEAMSTPELGFDGAMVDYAKEGFAVAKERWPELEKVIREAAVKTGVVNKGELGEYLDRGAAMFASGTLHNSVMVFVHGSVMPPLVYHDGVHMKVGQFFDCAHA